MRLAVLFIPTLLHTTHIEVFLASKQNRLLLFISLRTFRYAVVLLIGACVLFDPLNVVVLATVPMVTMLVILILFKQ